jgi:hypothetical protein
VTDSAASKAKAKTTSKSKAAPKKTAATTKKATTAKKAPASKKAVTAKKASAPKARATTKAAAPVKQAVSGEISSFDDSSGTGYVAVGDEWFPLDLSKVEFGDDHFVNWKPGRKVLATIDHDRVESICVDDEYSSD